MGCQYLYLVGLMADVIAIIVLWLMLMPLVADGMPLKFMWMMLFPLGFLG